MSKVLKYMYLVTLHHCRYFTDAYTNQAVRCTHTHTYSASVIATHDISWSLTASGLSPSSGEFTLREECGFVAHLFPVFGQIDGTLHSTTCCCANCSCNPLRFSLPANTNKHHSLRTLVTLTTQSILHSAPVWQPH